MKCFYLPGAPLNLTCDKALTGNVLMMKPRWLMCSHTGVRRGNCERLTFVNCLHLGPPLFRPLVGQWNIDLIDITTKIITVVIIAIVLSVAVASVSSLLSASFLPHSFPFLCAFVNRWLILLSASLIQCLFKPVYSFFYLSEQVIHPVSLSLLCSPCYLSVVLSLQKVITHWAHQPGVNSLHPLTDEPEKGAVAKLTTSSEEKHINGPASD